MSDNDYLIWSNEHRAWWGPGSCGYVARIEDAGRYTHAQALNICTGAMPGRRGNWPLQEIPVRLADVQMMLARFKAIYSIDPEPPK